MRSKRELMAARRPRRAGEHDVEHALQRRDGHALGRLVVALGAVGEVHAREAGQLERVGVRAAAGGDPARLVAAGAQRGLGGGDRRRGRLLAVAGEQPLGRDVHVALRGRGAVADRVDHPRDGVLGLARGPASAPRRAAARARRRRWWSRRRRRPSRRWPSSRRRCARAASRRSRARRPGSRCGRPPGRMPGVGGAAVELGPDAVVASARRSRPRRSAVAWSNT